MAAAGESPRPVRNPSDPFEGEYGCDIFLAAVVKGWRAES